MNCYNPDGDGSISFPSNSIQQHTHILTSFLCGTGTCHQCMSIPCSFLERKEGEFSEKTKIAIRKGFFFQFFLFGEHIGSGRIKGEICKRAEEESYGCPLFASHDTSTQVTWRNWSKLSFNSFRSSNPSTFAWVSNHPPSSKPTWAMTWRYNAHIRTWSKCPRALTCSPSPSTSCQRYPSQHSRRRKSVTKGRKRERKGHNSESPILWRLSSLPGAGPSRLSYLMEEYKKAVVKQVEESRIKRAVAISDMASYRTRTRTEVEEGRETLTSRSGE